MGVLRILVAAASAVTAMISAPVVGADPNPPGPPAVEPPMLHACNEPACTPGIAPNIVLGSYCSNTTYYAFGVTSWGRLVFCGSPRRYEPRWFRATEMHGVKAEGAQCPSLDGEMAQSPEGLFLTCVTKNGFSRWLRGDVSASDPIPR
ncbi:hypothetical protein [Mycolicibacterium sp. A43C]